MPIEKTIGRTEAGWADIKTPPCKSLRHSNGGCVGGLLTARASNGKVLKDDDAVAATDKTAIPYLQPNP